MHRHVHDGSKKNERQCKFMHQASAVAAAGAAAGAAVK